MRPYPASQLQKWAHWSTSTHVTVTVVASVACAFKIANFVVARRVRFTIVGFISAFVVIGTVVINISSSNYDVASAIIVSTSSTGVVVVKTEKALVGIGASFFTSCIVTTVVALAMRFRCALVCVDAFGGFVEGKSDVTCEAEVTNTVFTSTSLW